MPRVESLDEFVTLLERSDLLSEERRLDLWDAANGLKSARELADWIVKQRWLTKWQASQLLDGHEQLQIGKYRLLELIGRGGMGLVFKAEHLTTQQIVVLKVMSQLGNIKGVRRYVQEVRAASTLTHPHIVTTLDAGVADGCHFLVMDFLPGSDLAAIILSQSPLPVSWSCDVARQVATGLQHAHEQGLVHRDIKPSNILISPEPDFLTPHARILDFGLARIVSESVSIRDVTHTGAVLGTPDYISPEQAMSAKHADIRSDIFSLGCTLFQMITGEYPFPGRNVMEKLMARITTIPPSVSALRAEAHSELDEFVASLLCCNPNDRPQTPGEVADELARLALKIRRHESRIERLHPAKLEPQSASRTHRSDGSRVTPSPPPK